MIVGKIIYALVLQILFIQWTLVKYNLSNVKIVETLLIQPKSIVRNQRVRAIRGKQD